MPKFFFHLNGTRDVDGTELPDLHAVQKELLKFAGETIGENTSQLWDKRDWSFEVTDQFGLVLFTLQVSAGSSAAVSRGRETGAAKTLN